MKNTIKLMGIIAFVAVIGFAMTACDSGGGDSPSKFDGTTMAKTKWVMEAPGDGAIIKKSKATLTFTSDTAGKVKTDISWASNVSAETKKKYEAMSKERDGNFTSTYNKADNTGTIKYKDGTEEEFTADPVKKVLTTYEVVTYFGITTKTETGVFDLK